MKKLRHFKTFENIDNPSEYDNDIRDIKDILLELEDEFPYIEIIVTSPYDNDDEVFGIDIFTKDGKIFGSDIYSLEYNLNRSKFTNILMNCIEKISNNVLGKPIINIIDLFEQRSIKIEVSFEIES